MAAAEPSPLPAHHESRITIHETRNTALAASLPCLPSNSRPAEKKFAQAAAVRATHHQTWLCPLLHVIARYRRLSGRRKSSARITAFPSRKPQPLAPRFTKHETRITRRGFARHCPLLPALRSPQIKSPCTVSHSWSTSVVAKRKTATRAAPVSMSLIPCSQRLNTACCCSLLPCYCPLMLSKKFLRIKCPVTVGRSRSASEKSSAENALAHPAGLAGCFESLGSLARTPGQSLHGCGIARTLC